MWDHCCFDCAVRHTCNFACHDCKGGDCKIDIVCSLWKPMKGMEENKVEVEEAKKFDQNKLRMDLLPFTALEGCAQILTFGSKKYGDRNWENGSPDFIQRLQGALLRHFSKYMQGDLVDKESGMLHMKHVATVALMILELELKHNGDESKQETN